MRRPHGLTAGQQPQARHAPHMSGQRRIVIVHAGDPTMELTLAGINAYRRTHPGWMIRQQYQQPRNVAETKELLAWEADV